MRQQIFKEKLWYFNLEIDFLNFKESKITDMSAIDAVNKITGRYAKLNKTVHLRHLSADCRTLLKNADSEIDVNILEDPTYKIVGD